MKPIYRFFLLAILVTALVSMPFTYLAQPAAAATPANCSDSTNSSVAAPYTVEVCITTTPGSPLTGDATVTATVAMISGTNPGVNQLTFFLDSNYLITTFHSPWTFTLPTNKFVDGSHTLSVEALMLDTFTTSQASISPTFNTGTTVPPVVGNTFAPALGTTPAAGQPFVVAAVGDGADGGPVNASVASLIGSMNPNLFLYLGDVYDKGTLTEFMNWYDSASSFGQFKSITDPTVGSHEYLTGTDSGYQLYWDSSREFYSFDTGGWHFISLNSNTSQVPAIISSPQYLWLANDLATHTNPCSIVIYHHPYFTIGQETSNHLMGPVWQLLAQNHVTMVLNGNDHDYERWNPLDANGIVSPVGVTEFVVGTGGHAIQGFNGNTDIRVAASSAVPSLGLTNPSVTYGALKLSLFSDHAAFAFQSASGSTLDSGSIQCHPRVATIHVLWVPLVLK